MFTYNMTLETLSGDLRAYSKLEKGTFQHVDQLMAERQEKPELYNPYFYTADGNGYFLREDGGVDWAITREAQNLILSHLYDKVNSSFDQLVHKSNYRPDNAEALAARDAKDTIVVDMSKLRLSEDDEEWRYLLIRTMDGFIQTEDGYKAPNDEEQKVMERLGYNSRNLDMLKRAEIAKTKIYMLNPDYATKEIQKDFEHNSLWLASWLDGFYDSSDFLADLHDVDGHFRLRGICLDR